MAANLIKQSFTALRSITKNIPIYNNNLIPYKGLSASKSSFIKPLPCKYSQKKLFEQVWKPTSQSRCLFNFFNKDTERRGKKRVPKLVLVQNPLKWIMLKLDFSVLKTVWDPAFELDDFKYGTKQAISRVTQLISEGHHSDLNGLLTRPARLNLIRELDRNWNRRSRALIALDRDDIQISAPKKVYFIRIADEMQPIGFYLATLWPNGFCDENVTSLDLISDKKFCDVDMAFLALKWTPINAIDSLVFAEIFARFHREYTPHCIPEWTIAYFKVIRFQVLRPRQVMK